MVASVLLVMVALSPFGVAAQKGSMKKRDEGPGWRMLHHSFERTLTYDDTLGDWLLSAASMALRDRVQLLPPVKNRHGVFWNKKAIETTDFEITFTLSAYDREGFGGPQDGFVVFWLTLESFAAEYNEQAIVSLKSKDWYEGMKAASLTMAGNKPTFKGLALAFMGSNDKERQRQLVTALWNDGVRTVGIEDLLSEERGAQQKAIDWMSAGTQVKVRVSKDGSAVGSVMTLDINKHLAGSLWGWASDGVNVEAMLNFMNDAKIKYNDGAPQGRWSVLPGNRLQVTFNDATYTLRFEGSNRAVVEEPPRDPPEVMLYGGKDLGVAESDWQVIFRLPAGTFPTEKGTRIFPGFTGWTGSQSYLEVDAHRLEAVNFDARAIGEEDIDVLQEDAKKWLEALEDEKRFLNQATQAEAVVRLSKLLGEHVDRFDQAGLKLKEELVKMEERMDALGRDVSTYVAAAQAFSFEAQQFDPKVVRDHIVGIRAVLTKSKEVHDAKLGAVHQVAKDLKAIGGGAQLTEEGKVKANSVAEQARAVEELAARGSSQTNSLLLVMVLAVALLGVLFLSRMRYYEKKHYI